LARRQRVASTGRVRAVREPGRSVSSPAPPGSRNRWAARGDCYDNGVAESFFATLKRELVDRRSWPEKAELRSEIFDYIEAFYNRQRRHSTLGMLSPTEFENRTLRPDGAGLAASRLALTHKIQFTTPTASALA